MDCEQYTTLDGQAETEIARAQNREQSIAQQFPQIMNQLATLRKENAEIREMLQYLMRRIG
jgi:uncharacterized protein involved in exopolysaccharide biosynthesis